MQAFLSIAVQALFCAGEGAVIEGGRDGCGVCLSVSFVSVLVLVIW